MNIPPDQPNDLNRGPPPQVSPPHPIISSVQSFVTQVIDANREWTDAKDLAFRVALPLFSIAATALVSRFLDKRDLLLKEGENELRLARQKLANERKLFEDEKGRWPSKPLASVVDDLMARGNAISYQATKEIDNLQPLIREVLRVKCSLTIPRQHRFPVEKEIRSRLLKQPSPLDHFDSLKVRMLEDTAEIFQKDVAHCDNPWPLGSGNNGELYKLYAENWKLRIELEKHKQVFEQLKKSQFLQQQQP